MRKTNQASLVLHGNEVKFRLTAARVESKTSVHVDWVRFTCMLRDAPAPSVDLLFPLTSSIWDGDYRAAMQQKALNDIPDGDYAPSVQALDLAQAVCVALGSDFAVAGDVKKGQDFYRCRWPILRNEVECGWVGFLASGESPRQAAQSLTIHCNLFGTACTFAEFGWRDRLADLVDAREGDLTRCDLALDFFDGFPGGLDAVVADYKNGLCDVSGKRLKCDTVGDWINNNRRSFYMGSKEAGKQTNAYEKGDQLFGVEAGSKWLRIELRYGNKLRELPTSMLRNPASFFAGASDWHAGVLRLADCTITPESIPTTGRLPLETVRAECSKNIRWALQTAAPSIAAAWQFLSEFDFLELVTNKRLPGRLAKFKQGELSAAFKDVFNGLSFQSEGSPALATA